VNLKVRVRLLSSLNNLYRPTGGGADSGRQSHARRDCPAKARYVDSVVYLGIDPWAVRPEEDAQILCEKRIPLFIIHSTDDETVPFEHARRIKTACLEATLWKIDGYEHVGAYAHPEYRQRILGFLRIEVFAAET
jgi:pimeloyl-ACP methyl ester carboxylesterase